MHVKVHNKLCTFIKYRLYVSKKEYNVRIICCKPIDSMTDDFEENDLLTQDRIDSFKKYKLT